jgi:hypothetical protein
VIENKIIIIIIQFFLKNLIFSVKLVIINQVSQNLPLCIIGSNYQKNIDSLTNIQFFYKNNLPSNIMKISITCPHQCQPLSLNSPFKYAYTFSTLFHTFQNINSWALQNQQQWTTKIPTIQQRTLKLSLRTPPLHFKWSCGQKTHKSNKCKM